MGVSKQYRGGRKAHGDKRSSVGREGNGQREARQVDKDAVLEHAPESYSKV